MKDVPKEVLEAVRQAACDNVISCAAAHKLAEKLNVPPKLVGKAADQLKIKIKHCQLGCF
ncbi:MAG: hypothetical protein H0Z40_03005 [Desulfotomaculum sp.]|nr:hypothetical protein [Desulfotomaculum sp.]